MINMGIITLQLESMEKNIRNYTDEANINGITRKVLKCRGEGDLDTFIYCCQEISKWYSANINKIISNSYVYNTEGHMQSKENIEKIVEDINEYPEEFAKEFHKTKTPLPTSLLQSKSATTTITPLPKLQSKSTTTTITPLPKLKAKSTTTTITPLPKLKAKSTTTPLPTSLLQSKSITPLAKATLPKASVGKFDKVFIVHGRDTVAEVETARYLERLGITPIILHEQVSGSKTIIEKIEEYTDVEYAIVLYTPCDEGKLRDGEQFQYRARQNVVFEHGYLMGKLGRDKVGALVKGVIELPNDISGIVYTSMDDAGGWKMIIGKEMRKAGYTIDLNKLI